MPEIEQPLWDSLDGSTGSKPAPRIHPAFVNMPGKFSWHGWLFDFQESTKGPVKGLLNADAENTLAGYLEPLREELLSLVKNAGEELQDMVVTKDPLYQKEHCKKQLKTLFQAEKTAISDRIEKTLAAFDDKSTGFADAFKKAIGNEPDDAVARKILVARLENEKERLNRQKAFEDRLVFYAQEIAMLNAKVRHAKQFHAFTNPSGVSIESAGKALPDNITFTPGKKKYSLLTAFFTGVVNGTTYTIENGEHSFDPRDPEACKAFVASARAQNNGKTTKVTLSLGGGTMNDYQMYGKLSPDTSITLRKKAIWFMANLKYGFNEVPSESMTAEKVKDYFNKNGIIPPEFADVDLEMPPIPIVEITGFHPNSNEQQKFKRFGEIREALIECRMSKSEKDIAQFTEAETKGTLTDAQRAEFTTLKEKYGKLEAQQKISEPLDETPPAAPAA